LDVVVIVVLKTVCDAVATYSSYFGATITGVPLLADVMRPLESIVISAMVYEPGVTAVLAKVVAKDPVPLPVISPVSVIVWSPVFVPLRFDPVTVPVAATLVGVISPSPIEIVPVDVIGDPDIVIPSEPDAETEVTVPSPAGVIQDRTPEPFVTNV
jgi:hypothetical protein